MRRRDVLAGLLLASVGQRRTSAQAPGKVYRIAFAHPSHPVTDLSETGNLSFVREMFKELRRRGYVEGHNLVVDRYSGAGQSPPFTEMVSKVVRSNPDLIVLATVNLARAVKAATATIPIVGIIADPVAFGLANSLSRPGGNLTGVSADPGIEIWGKRLSILHEAIPGISRVSFLYDQGGVPNLTGNIVQEAARRAGISMIRSPTKNPIGDAEYRRLFSVMQEERADALVVDDSGENVTHRRLIVELANGIRVPAIYPYREFVELGGLMAYTINLSDLWRHMADQIDKILKGAKPADIPFYQAATYELVINLKTAKALGIEMPPSILARADEVIE